MASRLVTRVVVPMAAVPFISYKVHAAGEEQPKMKYRDLPIYDNPEDKYKLEYEPEQTSSFRGGISSVRQTVWEYLDSIQGTTDRMKDIFEIGKAHTAQTVDFIQNDPGVLPRAAVITVAGLGGIVAGYRGRLLRKGAYAIFAMTAATAVCYPHQAAEMSKVGWERVKDHAMEMWKKPGQSEVSVEPQTSASSKTDSDVFMTVDEKYQQLAGEKKD